MPNGDSVDLLVIGGGINGAGIAREIITHARQVFLVADHTKFGRNAVVRLGSIAEVSALFTDQEPPAEIRMLLAEHEIRLCVAEQESTPALAVVS